MNFGRQGRKTTISLPGTGLSHSTLVLPRSRQAGDAEPVTKQATTPSWIGWLMGFLLLLGLGHCMGQPSQNLNAPPKIPPVLAAPLVSSPVLDEAVVAVSSARGRATPERTGAFVLTLNGGEKVRVVKSENGWKQVVKDGVTFWVLANQLSSTVSPSPELKPMAIAKVQTSKPEIERRRRQNQASSTNECACSSRRVCVGPRGGRYCLNSNGNKVYGR